MFVLDGTIDLGLLCFTFFVGLSKLKQISRILLCLPFELIMVEICYYNRNKMGYCSF